MQALGILVFPRSPERGSIKFRGGDHGGVDVASCGRYRRVTVTAWTQYWGVMGADPSHPSWNNMLFLYHYYYYYY